MGDLTNNLSRAEFTCQCGCGFDTVDYKLIDVLQKTVDHFQDKYPQRVIRIKINSGNRCSRHNGNTAGASSGSQHLYGRAADFIIFDAGPGVAIPADEVAEYLLDHYPASLGIGRYYGRTHVDSRAGKARWDMRNKA